MPDILIRGNTLPKGEGSELCIRIQPDGTILNHVGIHLRERAIELPAHGDLIDRNELYELVKQRGKNWAGEWCDFECHITGNDIKNAPVIVPASEEEKT